MPSVEEVRAAIARPQLTRLKQLGKGIRVGKVLGRRVLVRTIQPYTALDDAEKRGLIFVPETVKEANTPLPSTGLVVMLGEDATEADRATLTGASVYFSKHAGSDLVVSEEDYKLLEIDEVMCTFEFDDNEAPIAEVTTSL